MSEKKKKKRSTSEEARGLILWNTVMGTNPDYTKKVSFGKRSYTTVDPYRQMEKATEMFGIYGIGWGVKEEKHHFFEACGKLHCLYTAYLFFQYEGVEGLFPLHSDITITEGKDSKSYKKDWSKIVATDALTKGLSKLGFNADIFLGKFDDVKYVREQRDTFKKIKTKR